MYHFPNVALRIFLIVLLVPVPSRKCTSSLPYSQAARAPLVSHQWQRQRFYDDSHWWASSGLLVVILPRWTCWRSDRGLPAVKTSGMPPNGRLVTFRVGLIGCNLLSSCLWCVLWVTRSPSPWCALENSVAN